MDIWPGEPFIILITIFFVTDDLILNLIASWSQLHFRKESTEWMLWKAVFYTQLGQEEMTTVYKVKSSEELGPGGRRTLQIIKNQF